MQTPQGLRRNRTCNLLWSDSANHCTTVPPSQLTLNQNSFQGIHNGLLIYNFLKLQFNGFSKFLQKTQQLNICSKYT